MPGRKYPAQNVEKGKIGEITLNLRRRESLMLIFFRILTPIRGTALP
jgi:50S ribosomal subunit-associated GTPase HflX